MHIHEFFCEVFPIPTENEAEYLSRLFFFFSCSEYDFGSEIGSAVARLMRLHIKMHKKSTYGIRLAPTPQPVTVSFHHPLVLL